jgi:uncharacterized lipoprotein YbaY
MTKRPTDRRTVLTTAGAMAVAAAARGVAAQATDLFGEVTFASGTAIPAGRLEVALEDPAIADGARRRLSTTRAESDGRAKAIAFALSRPADASPPATLRIVARLERADGWLLARGSARAGAGSPVRVRLETVMY